MLRNVAASSRVMAAAGLSPELEDAMIRQDALILYALLALARYITVGVPQRASDADEDLLTESVFCSKRFVRLT